MGGVGSLTAASEEIKKLSKQRVGLLSGMLYGVWSSERLSLTGVQRLELTDPQ